MENWTEFLVGSTLYTTQQYGSISLIVSFSYRHTVPRETADLLSISNQTNLAIKGIIAIKAMSVMSEVVGQSGYSVSSDFPVSILPSPVTGHVQTIANAYYDQWRSHAFGSDNHLLVQYGDESSWSLGENMFADMWLQTGLISQDVRVRSLIA